MLRKTLITAAVGIMLTASGCGEVADFVDSMESDRGKTKEQIIEEVGDLGFHPKANPTPKSPKENNGIITELEVHVYVGLNRSDDDAKADHCSGIIVWREHSTEDLLNSDGGTLQTNTNSDKVSKSSDPLLDQFDDCWQA